MRQTNSSTVRKDYRKILFHTAADFVRVLNVHVSSERILALYHGLFDNTTPATLIHWAFFLMPTTKGKQQIFPLGEKGRVRGRVRWRVRARGGRGERGGEGGRSGLVWSTSAECLWDLINTTKKTEREQPCSTEVALKGTLQLHGALI